MYTSNTASWTSLGNIARYEILAALFALSRRQNAALVYERRTAGPLSPEIVPDMDENKALLRDLAHYLCIVHELCLWLEDGVGDAF